MRWHTATLECPQCKAPCVLQLAAFSADSEISFQFTCPKCNEIFTWRVYASALAHKALMNDFMCEKVKRLIEPLAEAPKRVFTDDDLAELKELHILDEPEREVP